jgi:hypothetical protein
MKTAKSGPRCLYLDNIDSIVFKDKPEIHFRRKNQSFGEMVVVINAFVLWARGDMPLSRDSATLEHLLDVDHSRRGEKGEIADDTAVRCHTMEAREWCTRMSSRRSGA